MTTSTTIPVDISPEAAARIAKLGFQAEVQQMIDKMRSSFADLQRIEVELYDRYECGDEPGISIRAYTRPFDPYDDTISQLGKWFVRTFPPQVLQHISANHWPEAEDAG